MGNLASGSAVTLWLIEAFIVAVPVVLAITLHEASHGLAAYRLGDPTAKENGRLSLNPLRHVDLVGTVLLPGVLYTLGSLFFGTAVLFGWAKPVPVDPRRLRFLRSGLALVALAGPGANLLMGLGWALVAKLSVVYYAQAPDTWNLLRDMSRYGIVVNTALMVLNLLPLPPLDGGRVLVCVLPWRLARPVARIEPFGIPILIVLLFTPVLGWVILGPVQYVSDSLHNLAGIWGWRF
ncbi:MAG: site-2 protease family protein [Gammaproteobacteria bacterium]